MLYISGQGDNPAVGVGLFRFLNVFIEIYDARANIDTRLGGEQIIESLK